MVNRDVNLWVSHDLIPFRFLGSRFNSKLILDLTDSGFNRFFDSKIDTMHSVLRQIMASKLGMSRSGFFYPDPSPLIFSISRY